jgi:transaldolase
VTLYLFQPRPGIIARKACATRYVTPLSGGLTTLYRKEGWGIIEAICLFFSNYGFETEIIVASIRNPVHVLEASATSAPTSRRTF